MRKYIHTIKTPTTAVEMFNMANNMIAIMTCPLGGSYNEVRLYKMEQALDQLPDQYGKIIHGYISRKLDQYHTPNEDGYSAYDMDQAILRGA